MALGHQIMGGDSVNGELTLCAPASGLRLAARRAEERYKKAMLLEESLLEEANQARAHDQLLRERREKTLAHIRSGLVKIITIE